MGSCASLYGRSGVKAPPPPPETVTDKFEIPPSPIKHFKLQTNTESAIKDVSVVSHRKTPSGSKEEAFFDSRAWLDSDCDDFFSVKGDFTPSCGSTPLNHRFPEETPRASGGHGDGQLPTLNSPPLPAKRRKKLVELFRESLGGDSSFAFLNSEENPREDLASGKVDEASVSGAASVCSSESTAAGDELADKKVIGFGSKLCCLPPLVSRHSWSERKEDLAVNGVS